MVQSALNHQASDQLGGVPPITAFTQLPAQTPLTSVLQPPGWVEIDFTQLGEKQKKYLQEVGTSVSQMHQALKRTSDSKRVAARERRAKKKGVKMAKFSVGDFVLVGSVLKHPNKLAIRWQGPRRVVRALNDWTFDVQDWWHPLRYISVPLVGSSGIASGTESSRRI